MWNRETDDAAWTLHSFRARLLLVLGEQRGEYSDGIASAAPMYAGTLGDGFSARVRVRRGRGMGVLGLAGRQIVSTLYPPLVCANRAVIFQFGVQYPTYRYAGPSPPYRAPFVPFPFTAKFPCYGGPPLIFSYYTITAVRRRRNPGENSIQQKRMTKDPLKKRGSYIESGLVKFSSRVPIRLEVPWSFYVEQRNLSQRKLCAKP